MSTLRLELFVRDLTGATDFYERVLGFDRAAVHGDGYTVMRMGAVQLDLQPISHLSDGHPVKPQAGERIGLGIEIVVEVDDVHAVYDRVQAAGWLVARPLGKRPWGLTDFRVLDPDGRYVQLTSRVQE